MIISNKHNFIPNCDFCDTEMEEFDAGKVRGVEWKAYRCPNCGEVKSNEPDIE